MNGFINFISDSKVHDSVLMTMVVTSFLAAVRRFKEINNDPIAPGLNSKIKLVWNFFYDWLSGFWSMKTGQTTVPKPQDPIIPESPENKTKI